MEISDSAIWGFALVVSPFVVLLILITITSFKSDSQKPQSVSWVKWIAPLVFIVPLTIYVISMDIPPPPLTIFLGLALAVFLYGFCLLLILLFSALRKSKKVKDA